MISRIVAVVLGLVVIGLAVAGFFMEGRLGNLMNVDLPLDATRVVIGLALLVSVFLSRPARATILIAVGVLYVIMGLTALAEGRLFGLLPSGLSEFDIAFHLVAGLVAVMAPFIPEPHRPVPTTEVNRP